ncbi:MAG: aminoglycoside phosphotransferase family protein [Bdellovibrionales bacterium]
MDPKILDFIAGNIGTSSFETFQLAGDASSRKYYRVVFDGQSRVLMSWEPFADTASYPFLNVQRHFASVDIRVPSVNAISPELGVVLLEDLGDLTLERKFWENQDQSQVFPFYQMAVDELIKIHFLATRPTQTPSLCQTTSFDKAKFMWEMNYAREHFLEKVGGIKLKDTDQSSLDSEFQKICETLDQQPKVVCHRDYHSRNLMLKLGKVYVIDFQDARTGPMQYDLVSLVHDSYVRLSPESIERIKQDYIRKATMAREGGIPSDFEEIFNVQTVQRCFKACGSFASFFNMRGDTRYLKYIQHTVQLVEQTLRDLDRYPLFAHLLRDAGLLEKNYEQLCAV